jgi:drug/metabolite transporter (DMT)-like permease
MRSRRVEGLALAVLAAALWGVTPVVTKGALAGYSPEAVSVVRLALSAVCFRALAGPGTTWLPRDGWSWCAGLTLGLDFVLYNWGLDRTTAGLAGLVVNVEVASGVLLARWLLGEPLTARRLLGAAVTTAGVLAVAGDGLRPRDLVASETAAGNLAVMLAALAWSVYAVAQRRAPQADGVFRLMTPIFTVAFLTCLPALVRPAAWANPGGAAPTTALVGVAVVCTVGVYLAFARSQQCLDQMVLSLVLATVPVFAVGFAWLLLGEAVTPRVAVGGAVVVGGVLLVAAER